MKIHETDLEQRSYIFTINVVSFVKSMQKAGLENPKLNILIKDVNHFNTLILDVFDMIDENLIKINLKKSLALVKNCHELFMNIRCNDNKLLIQEKADLQIESTYLVNTISKVLI